MIIMISAKIIMTKLSLLGVDAMTTHNSLLGGGGGETGKAIGTTTKSFAFFCITSTTVKLPIVLCIFLQKVHPNRINAH